jgi:uncharacterized protein YggE
MSLDAGESGPRPRQATVSVQGEAQLRAEPDEATVWITLSALDDFPGKTLADVAQRTDDLVALLDQLGIAARDRSTTGVTVREEFEHTPEGRRWLGHRATATLSVRFTDLALIGAVMSRAGDNPDVRIDGPRWQISPANPVRLEAARQAAADAARKAQAFAEGAGARLGELMTLTEPGVDLTGPAMPASRAMASGYEHGTMPIEAGDLDVTAVVQATFALRASA